MIEKESNSLFSYFIVSSFKGNRVHILVAGQAVYCYYLHLTMLSLLSAFVIEPTVKIGKAINRLLNLIICVQEKHGPYVLCKSH